MDNFKARADEAQQRLARAIVSVGRAARSGLGLQLAAARLKRAQAAADAIIAEAAEHKRHSESQLPYCTDTQIA